VQQSKGHWAIGTTAALVHTFALQGQGPGQLNMSGQCANIVLKYTVLSSQRVFDTSGVKHCHLHAFGDMYLVQIGAVFGLITRA
jgi:hypothetical protein